MKPGKRVSQLLNIAFDMAAWVSSLCYSADDVLRVPEGNTRHSVQWRDSLYTRQIFEGMEGSDEDRGHCDCNSFHDGYGLCQSVGLLIHHFIFSSARP